MTDKTRNNVFGCLVGYGWWISPVITFFLIPDDWSKTQGIVAIIAATLVPIIAGLVIYYAFQPRSR